MAKSQEEEIIELLDKILLVLILQVGADKSITERVQLLKLANLDNKTIARALGTTDAVVRALTSASRRNTSKKKSK